MDSLGAKKMSAPGSPDFEELSARLREAEETLEAIRSGAVDAVVVSGPNATQVFTLQGADHPYRVMVEVMNEGALTVDSQGTILYSNARFADLVQRAVTDIPGMSLSRFISPAHQRAFAALLGEGATKSAKGEFALENGGAAVPVLLSLSPLPLENGPTICVIATDLRDQKARHAAEVSEARTKDLLRKLEQSQLQLHEKVVDLERSHEVMVGRELKMIALEKELAQLRQEVAKVKKK